MDVRSRGLVSVSRPICNGLGLGLKYGSLVSALRPRPDHLQWPRTLFGLINSGGSRWGGNPAMPPWGPRQDWLLSYCKLTSLTSFFCCDHHNNKRRLRFNTVFLWLTPTFLPDTFWLQGCGRWMHALIFYLSIVFSWI